jgi:hypothetical protein
MLGLKLAKKYFIVRLGVVAVIWLAPLRKKHMVFNFEKTLHCRLFTGVHTGSILWSSLPRLENHDMFIEMCTRLEKMSSDILTQA